MSSCGSMEQLFLWKLELDHRKLLKWKEEIDSLEVDLHALRLELKQRKEVEQPVVSLEESHTHEDNEVNFDLPPKFDEYEEREEEKDQEEIVEEVVDDDQSACGAFIILDSPQKCELEQQVQSLFFNGSCNEIQEVDWNSPPNFDKHNEQEDDEGELLELWRTLPNTEEPHKNGGVLLSLIEPTPETEPNESIVFNDSNLKPCSVTDKLENLRANSFLEGENDVSMGGLIDQIKKDSSQQESKAKNELYKAPRAVRKAVEAPGLLFVFDLGKGQL